MVQGQWRVQAQARAMEQSAATGRPGTLQTQTQAHAQVQAQAQADAPFGGMLAAGLIAGAVAGVIEERMAEAASRQAAPVVPSVPPAKDATSAGDHGLVTGGQVRWIQVMTAECFPVEQLCRHRTTRIAPAPTLRRWQSSPTLRRPRRSRAPHQTTSFRRLRPCRSLSTPAPPQQAMANPRRRSILPAASRTRSPTRSARSWSSSASSPEAAV